MARRTIYEAPRVASQEGETTRPCGDLVNQCPNANEIIAALEKVDNQETLQREDRQDVCFCWIRSAEHRG